VWTLVSTRAEWDGMRAAELAGELGIKDSVCSAALYRLWRERRMQPAPDEHPPRWFLVAGEPRN